MFCTACGSELDPQSKCSRCAALAPTGPATPTGDPFAQVRMEVSTNPWKGPALAFLSLVLFAFVIGLNYLKALRWAGVMNAESFGYMLGGVLVSCLGGLLGMYLVKRARGSAMDRAVKNLGVMGIAFVLSFFSLAMEFANPRGKNAADVNKQVGELLKEAAGRKAPSGNTHWWDGPSRDFFRDILGMNRQYTAEVAALDSSAIKDLYSAQSYANKSRMEKTVSQLEAALAVDEKYASIDPFIKKLEDRVAETDAPDKEKQDFLNGIKNSMRRTLEPRTNLLQAEQTWMKSTIDLYEFVSAHSSEYSVKGGKLYFRKDATREEFVSQQTKAIALHKDFLKAKETFEQSRKNKMDQLGVSSSDFTPEQLGKTK